MRESDSRRARAAGGEAHRAFRQESLRLGAEGLKRIEEENAIGIVCVGRPYNTTDGGMALDLPRKIAELGYVVLYVITSYSIHYTKLYDHVFPRCVRQRWCSHRALSRLSNDYQCEHI